MKNWKIISATLAMVFVLFLSGCKPKDSDVQTKINDQFKESPELSGVTATVENNIATLSGSVASDAEKSNAAAIAKNVKGVDSIVNHITANTPPPPSTSLIKDDEMMEAAKKFLKDYPGVNASVSTGVITLTGSIEKDKKSGLIDSLRTLNPSNIMDQLIIK